MHQRFYAQPACEWAQDGIRVNAVALRYIRTQRSELALDDD